MPQMYLHLLTDGSRNSLSIFNKSQLRQSTEKNANKLYRISPIFPVLPKNCKVPSNNESFYVGLYCFQDASRLVSTLLSRIPKERQSDIWFSHGIASIIIFSKDKEHLRKVSEIHKEKLRAFECWAVEKGTVEVIKDMLTLAPPPLIEPPFSPVVNYSVLPSDIQVIIEEVLHSLNAAVGLASQYLPRQIEIFRRLTAVVNDRIVELNFLHDKDQPLPAFLSAEAATNIHKHHAQRQKMIHQRTGALVQIAASLTAMISHAFSGAIPVLQSACPIRKYSLLGIGTAYFALSSLSTFVEKIFQRYPVDTVIKKHFDTAPPVDIFPGMVGYDPSKWAALDRTHTIDYHLAKVTAEQNKFNLVYFSTRIGFRESTYSITAPLQILSLSDDARWSPMTMSHELLHAHVRAIWGAIFADPERNLPADSFNIYFDRFINDFEHGSTGEGRHLIDSLRSIILQYCIMKEVMEEMAPKAQEAKKLGIASDRKVKQSIERPTRDLLNDLLKSHYRIINEIIVQVLDFHYFYDCNKELYLGLLWESWSPVPVVIHEIEEYVLRSMLAIASIETGSASVRFNAVCDAIIRVLSPMISRGEGNLTAQEARNLISNHETKDKLYYRFCAALQIVDMTRVFLRSAHINGALYDDPKCVKRDNLYVYPVDTGDFGDMNIKSPVALIADRLRRSLYEESSHISCEYRSAWFLFTCASTWAE